MKIETKFDIGQEVYYIDIITNKIMSAKISRIIVEKYDKRVLNYTDHICYQLGTIIPVFSENKLFATRKEAEEKLKR